MINLCSVFYIGFDKRLFLGEEGEKPQDSVTVNASQIVDRVFRIDET